MVGGLERRFVFVLLPFLSILFISVLQIFFFTFALPANKESASNIKGSSHRTIMSTSSAEARRARRRQRILAGSGDRLNRVTALAARAAAAVPSGEDLSADEKKEKSVEKLNSAAPETAAPKEDTSKWEKRWQKARKAKEAKVSTPLKESDRSVPAPSKTAPESPGDAAAPDQPPAWYTRLIHAHIVGNVLVLIAAILCASRANLEPALSGVFVLEGDSEATKIMMASKFGNSAELKSQPVLVENSSDSLFSFPFPFGSVLLFIMIIRGLTRAAFFGKASSSANATTSALPFKFVGSSIILPLLPPQILGLLKKISQAVLFGRLLWRDAVRFLFFYALALFCRLISDDGRSETLVSDERNEL